MRNTISKCIDLTFNEFVQFPFLMSMENVSCEMCALLIQIRGWCLLCLREQDRPGGGGALTILKLFVGDNCQLARRPMQLPAIIAD